MFLIVPGSLETRTGGYEYDRRMAAGLRARGWAVEIRELEGAFPRPTSTELDRAARVLGAVPAGATVLIDGLAFGAMPAQVEREASRLRMVALVHLPLAAEAGLDRETALQLEAGERRALAAAALVIVTGRGTPAALARYGVGRDRIVVVEPGTDPARLSRGSGGTQPDDPIHLLTVATLNPGKGHEILCHALAAVPHRNWRLTCAGSLGRHRPTVERLRARLRADGLEDRVDLLGELDAAALAACYDRADLFVLATLHETYGMAVAEALAHGLPVVSTTTGAIPELVGAAGAAGAAAGLLVPPGDVGALTDALSQVLGDTGLRARLAHGARRVRDRLPTWDHAVGQMASVLERVATR